MFIEGSALQTWVIAFFTLALFSILYKENPIYRFVESLFVGSGVAYWLLSTYYGFIEPTVTTSIMKEGKYIYIVPILLGLLVYCRFFKPVAWLARYSLAFQLGVAQGYILTRNPRPLLIDQITPTFLPLTSINNIILVLGVVCALSYFFFTAKRTGVLGVSANIGRWIMMVAFGSAFGNTVMNRTSVFLGSAQFILGTWLKVLK